ncbi:MAG: vWA domain-containing protein [Bacteroidota bacterium]
MKKIQSFWMILFVLISGLGACKSYEEVIPDPQIRSLSLEEAELVEAFSGLTGGEKSACSIIYETERIPEVLCQIVIEAEAGSEIVFLVDNTTSMRDNIDEVKANINEIIDCLPKGVRLGAATYSDANTDNPWFTYIDLAEDYDIARNFINAITLPNTANWDWPESVYDGLYAVLENMSWKDCSAPDKVIVMGDAEPHTGALTTYEVEDVIAKAASICPDTEFYPVIIIDD